MDALRRGAALAFVCFWGLASGSEAKSKSPTSEKRAVDPKAPDRTVLLKPDVGDLVEGLEGLMPELSSADAKLDAGRMKPEEHAKIVEAAVQKTVEAVRAAPESPSVQMSAARVMIQAGKLDEAKRYSDRASELAPDDPWPLVNRGIAEYESCDFPAASRSAVEALRRDPRNQNAKAMWSLSQRPAGCSNVVDKVQSRYVGGKLLEASAPGRVPAADLFNEGGSSAFDAGGPPGSAGAAAAVTGGAPGERYTREGFQRFQALMGRAASALKARENERAFDLATAAILAFPENPAALFIRGIAGMNLGRHDAVATDATWGMKLDPGNKAKWLGLRSNAEAASGRFDAALADAQAALRLDPNAADAWLASAKVKESLNHPSEDWIADYKRAAELNPAFTASYEEALARAQSGRGGGPSKAASPMIAGVPQDRFLALAAEAAAGGLILGCGVVFLLRRSGNRSKKVEQSLG